MSKKGFTLVELLVVVAIIGILATILIPNVQVQLEKAKIAKTKSLISSLEVVVTTYKADTGKYPPSYNPQAFYIELMSSKQPYDPGSDETRFFDSGQPLWIKETRPDDDRRQNVLNMAGLPSEALQAQEDEYVFVDAWENPIYFVSSKEYNPGGRTDYRKRRTQLPQTVACAYDLRNDGDRIPYKTTTFQICSFGPDETTIEPSKSNGGIFSMIDSDGKDNDGDDLIDNSDQIRSMNFGSNDPEHIAEDDITNFN